MIKKTPNGLYVSDNLTVDMTKVKPELKEKFVREVRDFNEGGRHGVAPRLVASVAATHAGLPTGNMAIYTPDRMRAGLPSFTDSFAKPVLAHHNDMADAVGRVHRATYVDLSNRYLEPMKAFKERYGGTVFTDAKVDLEKAFDQIDWIVENMVPMKDYVGLGYGELELHITDADAAEKIIDQRYLTVSVGFTTDSMYCSICHQDWASEGFCEHDRGKTYDSKQCLVVPGKFNYEEVSFVNSPADSNATVLSVSETPSLTGDYDQVLESVANSQDSMCTPILISVMDGTVSRLDSFKKITPERAQEVIDVAKKDNTQPKAPELVKATIDDVEVEFPADASDLLNAEDAKHENYITDEVDGHMHRIIIDPATGNGYTSYDTDHSHNVVNRVVEEGGDGEWNDETGKFEVKNPHKHELDKKVAPLTDSQDDAEATPEVVTEEEKVEDAKAKKKIKYKKVSKDVEGEDEIELEDGEDIPEGYELIEDASQESDADDVEEQAVALASTDDLEAARKAIEESELSDSQKARKLFELSKQADEAGLTATPAEFEVVEVELVDPTNEDASIKLAFTSEESFTESLGQMTQEAVEANKDQLEAACAVFGTKLPTFEDLLDPGQAVSVSLTKAEAQAQAIALFNNIDEPLVDHLIAGLNRIVLEDERKKMAEYIVDQLIAATMVPDIFADYNALAEELKDTREKLAAVTKSNRDFYAGKQDDLARVVVALKVALKKPEFVDLDEEALGAKTKELMVRSVDSLEDSLSDLINEFSDAKIEEENTNLVSETPVEPEVGTVVSEQDANRHDTEIFKGLNDQQCAVARRLQNSFKKRS